MTVLVNSCLVYIFYFNSCFGALHDGWVDYAIALRNEQLNQRCSQRTADIPVSLNQPL